MGWFCRSRDARLRIGEERTISVSMPLKGMFWRPFGDLTTYDASSQSRKLVGAVVKLNAPLLTEKKYGEVIEVRDVTDRFLGQLASADTSPDRALLYSLDYTREARIIAVHADDAQTSSGHAEIMVTVRRRILGQRT